ncbi:MAG: hypothetical protein DHS20C19_26090 [Acidimicrobiales bacterium]|nr:MAG: hypothetical protein DHS20C19_26090 [Acidimicrobiales bacterium]
MNDRNVDGGDMNPDALSAEQLAALLDTDPGAFPGHPVADALRAARASLDAESAPVPAAALAEILAGGRVTRPIPLSSVAETVIDLEAEEPRTRRTPVLQSIAAFVGTIAGKLVIGTTVAAASVGAAHGAGFVTVPGLPEIDEPAVVETRDDDADELGGDDAEDIVDTPDIDDDADNSDDSATDDPDDSDADAQSASDDSDDADTQSDSDDADTQSDSDDSDADGDDDSDADDSPTTSTIPSNTIADQQHTYTEAGVGTSVVAVENGQLVFVSAAPAAGWTLREAGPDEDGVDTSYEQGDLEVDIDFEIEDGRLRIRVRTENDESDERTEVFHWVDL